MNTIELKKKLTDGGYAGKLAYMYACNEKDSQKYANRFLEVIDGLEDAFGPAEDVRLFSAPGRTEIGGNHTDHQHGCVLAAGLNLDVIGAVRLNGTNRVRIQSKGYPMDEVDLDDLKIRESEFDRASALIRGILRKYKDMAMISKALTPIRFPVC